MGNVSCLNKIEAIFIQKSCCGRRRRTQIVTLKLSAPHLSILTPMAFVQDELRRLHIVLWTRALDRVKVLNFLFLFVYSSISHRVALLAPKNLFGNSGLLRYWCKRGQPHGNLLLVLTRILFGIVSSLLGYDQKCALRSLRPVIIVYLKRVVTQRLHARTFRCYLLL